MKKRLIIWGGNGDHLRPHRLDSHASVNAYFLTQKLNKLYRIVNLLDIDGPEQILAVDHVDAVLSTFQAGFTNRLVNRGKVELLEKIREHVSGPLCSICDLNEGKAYAEDIIFTVHPVNRRNVVLSRTIENNTRRTVFLHSGWSAEPTFCYPTRVEQNQLNVFIDHAPYTSASPHCTSALFQAFGKIARGLVGKTLHVYQQRDAGVVEWDFSAGVAAVKGTYDRRNKTPWPEMMTHYRRAHVFCLTHPESAGLSAIEAAMCGAVLYVPRRFPNRSFIPRPLLLGVPHRSFLCRAGAIIGTFQKDLARGFQRSENHKQVAEQHSWKVAAERIHDGLRQTHR